MRMLDAIFATLKSIVACGIAFSVRQTIIHITHGLAVFFLQTFENM